MLVIKGNAKFISISLVTRCPYCGTENWDNPKMMKNGVVCHHPTKIRGTINRTGVKTKSE